MEAGEEEVQESPGDKHSGKIYRRCESCSQSGIVIGVGGKVSSPAGTGGFNHVFFFPFYASSRFVAFTLHYIIKLFIVAKVKICKVHYGASHTTMSGYDCRIS